MTSQVLGLGLGLVGHVLGLGLGLVGHVLDPITGHCHFTLSLSAVKSRNV